MEKVIEGLGSVCSLSSLPCDTIAPHPRFSQYKQKACSFSQSERRMKFLEDQKNRRFDFVGHARSLAEGDLLAAETTEEADENMDCTVLKTPPRAYRGQLMLSEWLVEVPEDLQSNWRLVLCPEGKRCFVVASNRSTKAYSKGGYCVSSFSSILPGGDKYGSASYSMLDCIFSVVDSTYYVLDVVCWNGHPVFDSDTEFRFYWLQSQFEQMPDLSVNSPRNKYKFIPLPNYPCTPESISSVLEQYLSSVIKLDGLLFYNKLTHYTAGSTPLVGWLKPYMVPEILNIPVPDQYIASAPSDYHTLKAHLVKVAEQKEKAESLKKLNKKHKHASDKMDTTK